jgi:hypothetical protein
VRFFFKKSFFTKVALKNHINLFFKKYNKYLIHHVLITPETQPELPFDQIIVNLFPQLFLMQKNLRYYVPRKSKPRLNSTIQGHYIIFLFFFLRGDQIYHQLGGVHNWSMHFFPLKYDSEAHVVVQLSRKNRSAESDVAPNSRAHVGLQRHRPHVPPVNRCLPNFPYRASSGSSYTALSSIGLKAYLTQAPAPASTSPKT